MTLHGEELLDQMEHETFQVPPPPAPEATDQEMLAASIRIVALEVIRRHTVDVWESWEYYPEVGEDDWAEVVGEAESIIEQYLSIPYFSEAYEVAYAYLAKRAET